MTCSCYSKTNFDILLGKVCGECAGISKFCRFSCLFGVGSSFVLFCDTPYFSTRHNSCLHEAPGQCCLSPASVLSEMLNVTWLWQNADSGGWRFTLIHAGLRIVLLSLSISSAFSPCMWTVIMSGSAYKRPCTHSTAELCLGRMDPVPKSLPPKKREIILMW